MANYLITGGCGFIGSHLVKNLIRDGHRVRVLDNLSTGKAENIRGQCELVIGDVNHVEQVNECLEEMDGCFHLAAVKPVKHPWGLLESKRQDNLNGAINVLDAACRYHKPVVYASSSNVYGDNAELPLKEYSRLRPYSTFAVDTLGAEMQARVASLTHGISTTGLRLFNVYGPGQPESGVVAAFIYRLLKNKPLHVYGDGEQVRDFLYIDDAVRLLRLAMGQRNKEPQVFNACSGSAITINQLARSAMSILGMQQEVVHKPSRKGDLRGHVGDPSLARQRLGFSAQYRLADGLYRYIQNTQDLYPSPISCSGWDQASSQDCFLR